MSLLLSRTTFALALATSLFAAGCGGEDPPVTPPPTVTITTTSLPAGRVGVVYGADLAATGGTPATYAWSVVEGALPAGLTLSPAGRIAGTPTAESTAAFTVRAVHASGAEDQQALTLAIAPPEAEPVVITPATLPDGERGAAYAATLTARGGSASGYTWAVSAGALPPGLELARGGTPSTTLDGTPTSTGTFVFTARVTDSAGQSAEEAFTIRVFAPAVPLAIETRQLADGRIGTAYTATLAASGGVGPITWSITAGAVPPGLTLSTDGALRGTPTSTGTFAFTAQATDGATSPTQALSLRITAVGAPIIIVTAALPAGRAGDAYATSLVASGGSSQGYRWSVSAGALPPGLTLTATGTPRSELRGTPTAAGTFAFTVEVVDSVGQRQRRALTLEITPAFVRINVASTNLPAGTVRTPYVGTITAADGTGTGYAWLVTAGTLPTGLTLSPSGTPTAQITGTPIVAGTFTATITVFDSNNDTAVQAITLEIAGPLVPLAITSTALPNAGLGEPYAQTITATAGSAAGYQWSVVQGALPPGLALGATGTPSTQLSGSPTAAGDYTFTVQVTDSNGGLATQQLRLSVGSALIVTTTTLAPARLGQPYIATVSALGGNGTGFTWRVSQGALPAGLTLAASGTPSTTISGTPTASGVVDLTIEVRDSANTVAIRTLRLVVSGAQRFAAWVGDTAVDNDTSVFVVDLGGATPGAPVQVSPLAPTTGDAPTSVNYTQFSPDNTKIAFRGDFLIDGQQELYVVDLTGPQPAPPQRVNALMIAAGAVGEFSWSPDSRYLTYQADGDVNDILDQYIVDVSGPVPAPAVRVSGTMVNGGDVGIDDFGWSPDSRRLFYVADQEIDNVFYVYVTTFAAGTFPVATRVNQDLPAAADVDPAGLAFSGDSQRILYTADATAGVEELWMVDLSGATPGAPVAVSGAMQSAGDVVPGQTDISPDGVWVSFIADRVTEGANELWVVDITSATPTAPVRASDALVSGRNVLFSTWSPDSTRLIFLADRDLDEVDELFMIGVGGVAPLTPVKVNPSLPANRLVVNNDTNGFLWSPDGSWVAYRADPDVDNEYELFVAPVDAVGPGTPTQVNLPLPTGELVPNMFFSPDSQRIAFRASSTVGTRVELFVADLVGTTPSTARAVAVPAINNGAVTTAFYWFGSDRIVFSGDLQVDARTNAYVVDVTQNPAVPVQLNGPLPTGGTVNTLFAQSPLAP